MRVLLDEHVPVQVIELVAHLLLPHEVKHVHDVGWDGKKDKFLVVDAANRGFQVLVTNDRNQLNDPEELKKIKKAGIHHVTYSHKVQRLRGLGLAMGAVVAAMPIVMETLQEVSGQRLVSIKGLSSSPSARFQVIDPAVAQLTYWPR